MALIFARAERETRRHAREDAWSEARDYVRGRMTEWERGWGFHASDAYVALEVCPKLARALRSYERHVQMGDEQHLVGNELLNLLEPDAFQALGEWMLELGETTEHAEAVDRGLDFLIANASPVRPAEWDVDNNWALIYALDSVAKALQHPRYAEGHEKTPALREAGQKLLAGLKKYQSPRGGWGYYSSRGAGWRPEWATSFTTAAAVLAIIEAREAGLTIDEKVYAAGVRAVKRTRLPNKAYDYGVSAIPRHMRLESINQVKGSLGRIQVCNLALFRAGEAITEDDLVWGLIQFVKHHKFLDVARNKPIPHEAYYANAAYFYLFAHYYAAQVLEVLPAAKREQFGPHIQAGVLKARQKDGSMWDFWIASNTKAYGTAFGTMGLERTTQPTE